MRTFVEVEAVLPAARGRRFTVFVACLALLGLPACGGGDEGDGASRPAAPPVREPAVRDVATGLRVPWGIAFLPGGEALVSERTTGRIMRVPAGGGEASEADTVEGVDTAAGEGGLLGLAVSPDYARDGLVFAYFTSAEDNRIVRFRLGEPAQPVLTGLARNAVHNGGRIAFGPDGMLYVGTGDAGNSAVAQDPESLNGKILRLRPDGGVPDDNPFRGSPVISTGHRNVQGLTWDRGGRLWQTEFGQDRFDEVNLIRPGRNYGWPTVEGRGGTLGGRFTNPLVTWTTSEASPSGAAVAGGALYVAALRGERLWRVPLRGARTGTPQALLEGRYGRLRTVERAPDGSLWVTTSNGDGRGSPRDGDDRILRVEVPG